MVGITLAIKTQIEEAQGIRDASASRKRKAEDFCPTSTPGTRPTRADNMLLLPSAWTYEAGVPMEAWIVGFRASVVLVISGTGADTICFFSPRYGSEEPLSVTGCYASTFGSTDKPEGPEYGSRSGAGLTGQEFGDLGACLLHCTIG